MSAPLSTYYALTIFRPIIPLPNLEVSPILIVQFVNYDPLMINPEKLREFTLQMVSQLARRPRFAPFITGIPLGPYIPASLAGQRELKELIEKTPEDVLSEFLVTIKVEVDKTDAR